MSHGHDHTPPSLPTPLSDADTLHRLGPGEARAAVGDWLALYTACFSTQPWSEPVRSLTEYQQQVGWHFEQPGFRALDCAEEVLAAVDPFIAGADAMSDDAAVTL